MFYKEIQFAQKEEKWRKLFDDAYSENQEIQEAI